MRRSVARTYGLVAYLAALCSLVWLVAFVHDWGLAHSIDRGAGVGAFRALAIDFALLACFGFQHSVMARSGFKAVVTEHIPEAIERSTYVLASTFALALVLVGWQPIPITLYDVREGVLGVLLPAVSMAGFGLMLASTFIIDHLDLFGLKQVYRHARGVPYDPPELVVTSIYKHLRHPLYVGWLIFFWATPHMTVGHAFLAAWMTAYVLIAVPLEERDLVATLGGAYRRYRDGVPRFLPKLRARPGVEASG